MKIAIDITEEEVKRLCDLVDIEVDLEDPDLDVEEAIRIILSNF